MEPIATPNIRAPESAAAAFAAAPPAPAQSAEPELLALRAENERLQALVTDLLLKNQALRFALEQAQLQSAATVAFF